MSPLILTTPFTEIPPCTTADTLIATYPKPVLGGEGLDGIAFDSNNTLWVSDAFGFDSVRTFNPATGTYTGEYAAGSQNPRGLVFDGVDSIWIAGYGSATINKINISTKVLTTGLAPTFTPWNIVRSPASGWIWVDRDNGNTITGIPVAGGATKSFVTNTTSPRSLLSDSLENVWAIGSGGAKNGDVQHYNFNTAVITTIPAITGAGLAEGNDGFIYVISGSTVYRIDKVTLTVVKTISLGASLSNDNGKLLVDTGGYIWSGNRRFDPVSETVLPAISGWPNPQSGFVGGQGTVQSAVDGHVFTVNSNNNIYRASC